MKGYSNTRVASYIAVKYFKWLNAVMMIALLSNILMTLRPYCFPSCRYFYCTWCFSDMYLSVYRNMWVLKLMKYVFYTNTFVGRSFWCSWLINSSVGDDRESRTAQSSSARWELGTDICQLPCGAQWRIELNYGGRGFSDHPPFHRSRAVSGTRCKAGDISQ